MEEGNRRYLVASYSIASQQMQFRFLLEEGFKTMHGILNNLYYLGKDSMTMDEDYGRHRCHQKLRKATSASGAEAEILALRARGEPAHFR